MISFWDNIWLHDTNLRSICWFPNLVGHELVKDVLHENMWSESALFALCVRYNLPTDLIESIKLIPLTCGARDAIRWTLSPNGEFSFASAWDKVRARRPTTPILVNLWYACLSPSISFFLWRLFFGRIPIDTKLQKRNVSLASKCLCCARS